MAETNQVEHEQISTSLEVERLEVNLFRSNSLWLPVRARGAFGGQVISQALVSATNCVEPEYALHSMHCYFLLGASPAVPTVYSVERIRDGKSYVTRSVKAIQNGAIIFMMLCSFQRPETWQPSHQYPMPENVPSPEECEDLDARWARRAADPNTSPRMKILAQEFSVERSKSPIAIKVALEGIVSKDGVKRYMYWMKARDIPKYEAPFQKCILAYASDLQFIGSSARTMGMRQHTNEMGVDRLGMMSTLDHTLWFYNNDFDFGQWALYVIECPAGGSGRAVVTGKIYTRDGDLIAVAAQEGVVRAAIKPPSKGGQPKL